VIIQNNDDEAVRRLMTFFLTSKKTCDVLQTKFFPPSNWHLLCKLSIYAYAAVVYKVSPACFKYFTVITIQEKKQSNNHD